MLPVSQALLDHLAKERHRWTRRRHKQLDTQRYVASEWDHIVRDLQRERGLWGPEQPCALDKWMLDTLEGPARMRRRLKANPTFYADYPPDAAADADGSPDQLVRPHRDCVILRNNVCVNVICEILCGGWRWRQLQAIT